MTLSTCQVITCDVHGPGTPVLDTLHLNGKAFSGRSWYILQVTDTDRPNEPRQLTVCIECFRRLNTGTRR